MFNTLYGVGRHVTSQHKLEGSSINIHRDKNIHDADESVENEGQADLMLSDHSCWVGRGQCCHFWEEQRKCGL